MKLRTMVPIFVLSVASMAGAQTAPGGGFGGGGFGGSGGISGGFGQGGLGGGGAYVNALGANPKLDMKVTFKGKITLRTLPEWLSKHGISYVIPDPDRMPDRSLALNIVDKPLRDVMLAMSFAVNGHWVASGDIYSLQVPMMGFWGVPPPQPPKPRGSGGTGANGRR